MNLANDTPPLPPREPDPGDCCGEGCTNCVFDIYETAMARYLIAMAAWERDRLS